MTEQSHPDDNTRYTARANALISDDRPRTVERNGREYLVFPMVFAREMVLNYPEWNRREYLSAERLAESVPAWAGTPLTVRHPTNPFATVNTAESFTGDVIGRAHNPQLVDGEKVRADAWVDVAKAESLGGLAAQVVDRVRRNSELAVSAGYRTMDDDTSGGVFEGTAYDIAQGQLLPDHIAVFPPDAFLARCSPEDGCAAPRANAASAGATQWGTDTSEAGMTEDTPDGLTDDHAATFGWRVLHALGLGRTNTQSDCTCDDAASCACTDGGEPRTNVDSSAEDETTDAQTDEQDPDADAESEADAAAAAGADDDGSGDGDSQEMTDYDIEALAARSAFTVEALDEWDDDQLAALDETLSAQDDTDDDSESTETDSTESDAEPDQPAQPPTTETPETAGDDQLVAEVQEMKENYASLQQTIEELKEEKTREGKRADAQVVANALDISEEEALEMPESTLSTLAEKHGHTQPRVNYGGVPGPVDRTPTDDADEYPAGTRAAYEARQNGGGD